MTMKLTQAQFDYITSKNLCDLNDLRESWAFKIWQTMHWVQINTQNQLDKLLDEFDNQPIEKRNWYSVGDPINPEYIQELLNQWWTRGSIIEISNETYYFYFGYEQNRKLLLKGMKWNSDWKKINELYTVIEKYFRDKYSVTPFWLKRSKKTDKEIFDPTQQYKHSRKWRLIRRPIRPEVYMRVSQTLKKIHNEEEFNIFSNQMLWILFPWREFNIWKITQLPRF